MLLYARTIRHLRLAQVAHRARLRAQRRLVARFPDEVERLLTRAGPAEVGWPDGFTPIDACLGWPSLPDLEAGELTLLGYTRALGTPPDWQQHNAGQLWRFHLHYWDWAWGLAQEPDRLRARAVFRRLLMSWQSQTHFGLGDEWSPYVVALRAWSWCGQYNRLVRGSDMEEAFVSTLGVHAGYLKAHLEFDVGGNHLIKNLKALIGLGIFLRDEPLRKRGTRLLQREIARQVLPDGGHFERAPAYHCQVLSDLIDLQGLLADDCPPWLSEAVERMRSWLGIVLLPDGSVPLLNDGYRVAPALVVALQPGSCAAEGLTLLPDSGLAIIRRGQVHLLADIGLPCPDELPAHAHADTLSFLLYAGTTPLVGECGTSTYEPGSVRDYERGTAAHSTVQVDGVDSTEVWGAFRAARRARPAILYSADEGGVTTLAASHDGYARLPGSPVHTRTWKVTDAQVHLVDEVTGSGEHDVVFRLHGTPRHLVRNASGALTEGRTQSAVAWGRRERSAFLEHAARSELPWRFEVQVAVKESV